MARVLESFDFDVHDTTVRHFPPFVENNSPSSFVSKHCQTPIELAEVGGNLVAQGEIPVGSFAWLDFERSLLLVLPCCGCAGLLPRLSGLAPCLNAIHRKAGEHGTVAAQFKHLLFDSDNLFIEALQVASRSVQPITCLKSESSKRRRGTH